MDFDSAPAGAMPGTKPPSNSNELLRRDKLNRYPAIQGAFDFCRKPNNKPYLDLLLEAAGDGFYDGILHVEKALSNLLTGFSYEDLEEQVQQGLFAGKKKWSKAETELLGLAYFHHHGNLAQIGWPSGYGGAPPFDGVLKVQDYNIPFDIKSACNGGLSLIKASLEEVAQKWAATDQVTVEVRSGGGITRQVVGCHKKKLMSDFVKILDDAPPWDGEISRKFQLRVGKTSFRVDIFPADRITVDRSFGGGVDRPKSILETIQGHVSEKRDQCEKNHCPGFMLVYVRPPMCGTADMNPNAFQKSFSLLLNQKTAKTDRDCWLGAAMIDWTASRNGKAKTHLVMNSRASWPNGMTKEDIAGLECF